MNYASMIEEKKLKQTFIMATLASTLVGTFTASMSLWERIDDKRHKHKQRQTDTKQDDEIKQLRGQVEKLDKDVVRRSVSDRSPDRRGYRDRNDVGYALKRDGMMVQRTYNDMEGRMGIPFAQGDAIVENQLQAQIISLQQTVINVLQDALYNDRQLTRADMTKLVAASNAARDGSLDALREAQKRLGSPERARSASPQRSQIISKRAPSPISDGQSQLYCRYSSDLQIMQDQPLAAVFAPGGSCQCPSCGVSLDVMADDFWKIGKRTPCTVRDRDGYEIEIVETREFRLGQRFVLKCHTPDGEFACLICAKYRDVDAICRTVESLVKHVGTFHDADELDGEIDLRELKVETRRMSLPAPRDDFDPHSRGDDFDLRSRREEVEVRGYR